MKNRPQLFANAKLRKENQPQVVAGGQLLMENQPYLACFRVQSGQNRCFVLDEVSLGAHFAA